ncbi:MAG: hypothetical protein AAGF12_03025 [Myxococcota bacterium]
MVVPLPVRMFKLRMWDQHVHFVPDRDLAGEEFSEPGVDLRGDEAEGAFVAAAPLFDVLSELEPGIEIRSLSVDLPRVRLLATLHPRLGETRPRVIRIDHGPTYDRALEASTEVLRYLGTLGRQALLRREARSRAPNR